MFLSSPEILALMYAFLAWLVPNLILLALLYFVVRTAVEHALDRHDAKRQNKTAVR